MDVSEDGLTLYTHGIIKAVNSRYIEFNGQKIPVFTPVFFGHLNKASLTGEQIQRSIGRNPRVGRLCIMDIKRGSSSYAEFSATLRTERTEEFPENAYPVWCPVCGWWRGFTLEITARYNYKPGSGVTADSIYTVPSTAPGVDPEVPTSCNCCGYQDHFENFYHNL